MHTAACLEQSLETRVTVTLGMPTRPNTQKSFRGACSQFSKASTIEVAFKGTFALAYPPELTSCNIPPPPPPPPHTRTTHPTSRKGSGIKMLFRSSKLYHTNALTQLAGRRFAKRSVISRYCRQSLPNPSQMCDFWFCAALYCARKHTFSLPFLTPSLYVCTWRSHLCFIRAYLACIREH